VDQEAQDETQLSAPAQQQSNIQPAEKPSEQASKATASVDTGASAKIDEVLAYLSNTTADFAGVKAALDSVHAMPDSVVASCRSKLYHVLGQLSMRTESNEVKRLALDVRRRWRTVTEGEAKKQCDSAMKGTNALSAPAASTSCSTEVSLGDHLPTEIPEPLMEGTVPQST